MSPARARTRTARSGVEHTNHEATAPPTAWVAGEILRECFCFGSEAVSASGEAVIRKTVLNALDRKIQKNKIIVDQTENQRLNWRKPAISARQQSKPKNRSF